MTLDEYMESWRREAVGRDLHSAMDARNERRNELWIEVFASWESVREIKLDAAPTIKALALFVKLLQARRELAEEIRETEISKKLTGQIATTIIYIAEERFEEHPLHKAARALPFGDERAEGWYKQALDETVMALCRELGELAPKAA